MTPAAILTATACALYGPRWLRPLARDCGQDASNLLRAIRADSIGPRHVVWGTLLEQLSSRQLALNEAADTLERWLAHTHEAA